MQSTPLTNPEVIRRMTEAKVEDEPRTISRGPKKGKGTAATATTPTRPKNTQRTVLEVGLLWPAFMRTKTATQDF